MYSSYYIYLLDFLHKNNPFFNLIFFKVILLTNENVFIGLIDIKFNYFGKSIRGVFFLIKKN